MWAQMCEAGSGHPGRSKWLPGAVGRFPSEVESEDELRGVLAQAEGAPKAP